MTVDGVVRRAKDTVREGSRIEVHPMARATTDLSPDASVPFEVLHVDDDLVVLVKPSGVVVHPAPGSETGTLVHGLLSRGYFHALDAVDGDENVRPGIVHRLDKGTSGVMVVARTVRAREGLKVQFQEHTIERAYDAICVGVASSLTHRTMHGRHPKDRMKFTSRVTTGKLAVTHIELVETLAGGRASLARCRLDTGRTHQIRVHLAEGGTPVLGDPLYGKPAKDPGVRAVAERLGHQALHARLLGFVHPGTRQPLRFEAPWPADFTEAVETLRRLP